MTDIGKINRLTVKRKVDAGALLDGGAAGDILLPKKYVSRKCKPGDKLEAFVYIDREKRLLATLKNPFATVGQTLQKSRRRQHEGQGKTQNQYARQPVS